jgi:hypothetical protein
MERIMKKQLAKAVRAILGLMVLAVVQGCTTPLSRITGESWSQLAAEKEREQQLSESPQGDWNMLP